MNWGLRFYRTALARWRWWLTPWEVELFRLDQRPVADQAQYLSWRAMNVAVRPALHDPQWESVVANKWMSALFYEKLGVAVPRTFGFVHPQAGVTTDGRPLRDVADLVDWCRTERPPSLVIKPVGGNQGRGVLIVDAIRFDDDDEPTFSMVDGMELDAETLAKELTEARYRGLDGHLVQERVVPTLTSSASPAGLRTACVS